MEQLVKNYSVTEQQTAKHVGSGDLDVLATPSLVAMFENCAKELLADGLQPEQTSVGFTMELKHLAPSRVGATITVTAEICAQHKNRVEFQLTATDGTRKVGEAQHQRVIVNAAHFMEKLAEDQKV